MTSTPSRTSSPVRLTGELDPNLSRWLWLVKMFLAIPHYVVLAFLWVAFVVTTVIAGFAIVFTGRYPRPLFDFNVGVLRWNWRVGFYVYAALGTDRYPPFTLARTDYPADFDVAYPDRLSRGLVLVKWLLAIPHLLIVGLIAGDILPYWWTTTTGRPACSPSVATPSSTCSSSSPASSCWSPGSTPVPSSTSSSASTAGSTASSPTSPSCATSTRHSVSIKASTSPATGNGTRPPPHPDSSARRPESLLAYDAGVMLELAAAHAAVDEAVEILRQGRTRPQKRIDKAAKDFLTEVDLASEAALKRALAASTPEIGFYGEEGGGAALETGRVWVADPLDGTINYATGSPLCGVMLGLLEDGVPVLGVIDLPFLGVRVDSGAVVDVDGFDQGIIGMGDAFHRGGARMDAYLQLTATVHRQALRFRCVGAASVLWTWLVSGQIQGMVLAHNNPYDVVAGHAIAQAAGAVVTDYAGAPLTLESSGAMAAMPGVQPELVRLAADLAAVAVAP